MVLSITRQELFEYVSRQMNTYFPDKCTLGGDKRAFDLALERLEYCFKHISVKNYNKNGQVNFYHLHMDQYSTFLYYYANSIWKLGGEKVLADKLILLNRALSGMWCSYTNNLPDIFCFVHPVGTVLGNANYSDYLVVLQNVTVNTMEDDKGNRVLDIGKGCYLSAGATIIKNSTIGDWCTVGENTTLHDTPLSDGQLAYTDKDGRLNIKRYDNSNWLSQYFYI